MSNGASLDLSKDPGSAVGLLSFVQSSQALADGTVSSTDSSGRTYRDSTKMNIFENLSALPNFFSPETKSLGVHVTV
jgi:hypothetical protein